MKPTTVKETSFSRFIREASTDDKVRIYAEVLRKASERQLKGLEPRRATGEVAP